MKIRTSAIATRFLIIFCSIIVANNKRWHFWINSNRSWTMWKPIHHPKQNQWSPSTIPTTMTSTVIIGWHIHWVSKRPALYSQKMHRPKVTIGMTFTILATHSINASEAMTSIAVETSPNVIVINTLTHTHRRHKTYIFMAFLLLVIINWSMYEWNNTLELEFIITCCSSLTQYIVLYN